MPDNSFDIVSKIDLPEVSNAVQQAVKEIQQRFDLKDSRSSIELREKENKILLASSDEFKLKAVTDVLQAKLVKRSVPLKGLSYGVITPAGGSTVRQEITLQQGIAIEKARDIVKTIKDSKKKAQASIQGDLVRVSAKDRDTLQEIIAILGGHPYQVALDRGLRLFLRVLDGLDDIASLFDGDTLLQRDLLAHSRTAGRSDDAVAQSLERHAALHQLGLQDVGDRLELEFIGAGQQNLVLFLAELNRRAAVFEVEALLDFFDRLLHGVADFGQVDLGYDVETVIWHKGSCGRNLVAQGQ